MAKKKYLTVTELRDQLNAYMEREDRLVPVEIIEQLEDKILQRASEIAKKKKENAAGKTYITQEQLDQLMIEIFRSYTFAEMEPGTSAGVVSAQSIGEPGTQMSLSGDELVLIMDENVVQSVRIGEFIDELLESKSAKVNGETAILDFPPHHPIFVPAISDDETIAWKRLRQVSRHAPNGDLIRVKTKSGRQIIATPSHSFLARKNNKIVPIRGSELRPGDFVPIALGIPSVNPISIIYFEEDSIRLGHTVVEQALVTPQGEIVGASSPSNSFSISLDETFGYFLGTLITVGFNEGEDLVISTPRPNFYDDLLSYFETNGIEVDLAQDILEGELYEIRVHNEDLAYAVDLLIEAFDDGTSTPVWILNTPHDFIKAFLHGVFDHGGEILEGHISFKFANHDFIMLLTHLIGKFGIFTEIRRTPEFSELIIPSEFLLSFNDHIGFRSPKKSNKLLSLVEHVKRLDLVPGLEELIKEFNKKLGTSFPIADALPRHEIVGIIQESQKISNEKGVDISNEISMLVRASESPVFWDTVLMIEHIESPTKYVYDFAVDGFETFTTFDGILTHNTLRTFHFAGVREMNVTLGLPRLIELVDARRNPSTPSMTVALKGEYAHDEAKAKQVAQNIELTTVHSVASGLEIDQIHLRVNILLDRELLEDKGITAEDVRQKILEKRVASKVKVEDNLIIVTPDKEDPTLQDLQKLSEKLRMIPIKGLRGVARVMIRKKKIEEGDEEKVEYQILTEGSNFKQLMRVLGVDPRNSYTNHIHEIAETLGIEAARNAIIKEAKEVMEKQGLEVDQRHLMLVADLMTYSGEIRQIGRHGISGENASILARAGFEVTVKHLLDASVRGEEDHLVGIIENVIVGQEIAIGTGMVDLTISPNYREFAPKKEK